MKKWIINEQLTIFTEPFFITLEYAIDQGQQQLKRQWYLHVSQAEKHESNLNTPDNKTNEKTYNTQVFLYFPNALGQAPPLQKL